MALGADAPGGLAENELKLTLSMGEENTRKSKGKSRNLVVLGCEPPRELIQNDLKLPLNMERKIIEIPQENQEFWWSWVASHRANLYKMTLSCPSV